MTRIILGHLLISLVAVLLVLVTSYWEIDSSMAIMSILFAAYLAIGVWSSVGTRNRWVFSIAIGLAITTVFHFFIIFGGFGVAQFGLHITFGFLLFLVGTTLVYVGFALTEFVTYLLKRSRLS